MNEEKNTNKPTLFVACEILCAHCGKPLWTTAFPEERGYKIYVDVESCDCMHEAKERERSSLAMEIIRN